MEKKLISEINRYREIVGLPRINEATISGSGLIGKLLGLVGFVDNVADEAASAAVKLETNAAADATGEIAAKLARIKDELAEVAEAAAIQGAKSLSIQDLIYVLKRSQNTKVKTDLIKVLNRYFDESNIITSDFIIKNKALLGQIDNLDSKVLRDTLEETLGLQGKYLDEIISTFYKGVTDTDVATLLKKLGISFDDASTETIRKEVFDGLETTIANPNVKKYVKFIGGNDGKEKMRIIYNKSFDEIRKMGGITEKNSQVFFNTKITELIKELKDAGMTKDSLTQFYDGVKGVMNWLTGYNNIQKSKGFGKALSVGYAIPRAYVLGWGAVSLITGIAALGETAFTSDESLLKQYLQTEEGNRLYNEGDLYKFNENFNQWKSALYQGMISATNKFLYPIISALGGIDLDKKSNFTKEQINKMIEEINQSNGSNNVTIIHNNALEDKDGKKGFKSWLKTEVYSTLNLTSEDEKFMVQDASNKSKYYFTPYNTTTNGNDPQKTFEYKDGKFQEIIK